VRPEAVAFWRNVVVETTEEGSRDALEPLVVRRFYY
jgi:hypothetical protein